MISDTPKVSSGNNLFNEPLGKITHWEPLENGVRLTADAYWMEVETYSNSIIRINVRPEGKTEKDFSYALVASPQQTEIELEDGDEFIWLKTSAIHVKINKDPLRLSFYTPDGKLINADHDAFGTSHIGHEVSTYKEMIAGERFIGLGEKTGGLDRKGSAFVNWNTDKFAYDTEQDPLYLSTPFFIGIHSGLAYGIFLDNSHKTTFNFGASTDRFTYFTAENGEMNYYFIHHDEVKDIISSYTHLCGRIALPPKWSLGLHQCRYSYYPDTEVKAVAQAYRDKAIPADVIYLDIHYMEDYKVFTFHPDRFPDPSGLAKHLEEQGFNLAVIIDPGIKKETGYAQYHSGMDNDHFVKYPDGVPFAAQVWPGWSCFPDFTKEETRQWWKEQLQFYVANGITGFWNDMNEPACWGQHIPDLIEFDYEGEKATHKKARNVYGMQMTRSTYEGAQTWMNGKRPFILTRAGYSGIQRYGAVWTGDNISSDEHMLLGVRLLNSMGLTGIANAGYDVGGFAEEASPELFARWISIGAFSPFFRCHSMVNTRDSEPWSFGEEVEQIARNYIRLRYRLMPYIYSTFYEASENGIPVVRSLAIDHPHEEAVYDYRFEHQYLFGPGIMVAPTDSKQNYTPVYLPEGAWYKLFTDEYLEGGQEVVMESPKEKLPLLVKAGSIIPMQGDVQHLKEQPEQLLHIHLYKGKGITSFEYYEDDGTTYEKDAGSFMKRMLRLDSIKNQLSLEPSSGNFESHFKKAKLYFHGFETLDAVQSGGKNLPVNKADFRFVDPVEGVDVFFLAKGGGMEIKGLQTVEVEWSEAKMSVSW